MRENILCHKIEYKYLFIIATITGITSIVIMKTKHYYVNNLDDIKRRPYNVTHLTFGYSFNYNIKKEMLPPTITSIIFGHDFNKQLKQGVLPNSLTHLTFDYYFNQKIEQGILPNSLTHLTFNGHFNQKIEQGVLPNYLTHLEFGFYFNQKIEQGVLPNYLTHLEFGFYFNQKIEQGVLPNSLTHLKLGKNFNHKIEVGTLPHSLTYLTFYGNINTCLEKGSLPNSTTYLIIVHDYNKIKRNIIPNTVVHIIKGHVVYNRGTHEFENLFDDEIIEEALDEIKNDNLVKAIHILNIKSINDDIDIDEDCPICLGRYENALKLSCKHFYCLECLLLHCLASENKKKECIQCTKDFKWEDCTIFPSACLSTQME